ncbi:MAG: DnaJ domain-containing protein [Spirochaetota bacterium]|nr:DnaJ domain-containing protein [Spirochaetota bacterium]
MIKEKELNINELDLLVFLKKHPVPVLETTLLREFFPNKKSSFKELDFDTVQMHFILYHHLHKLAYNLHESNYLLYINYIYIYLLKKPGFEYCPHFNEATISFCLSEKENDDIYCKYHLEKHIKLTSEQFLKPSGVEGYYLDINNFSSLKDEYPELINRAKKIKKFIISSRKIDECYDIFGLRYGASFDKIQMQYKSLAKKYHPDVNSSKSAYQKFQSITEAYNLLKSFLMSD